MPARTDTNTNTGGETWEGGPCKQLLRGRLSRGICRVPRISKPARIGLAGLAGAEMGKRPQPRAMMPSCEEAAFRDHVQGHGARRSSTTGDA